MFSQVGPPCSCLHCPEQAEHKHYHKSERQRSNSSLTGHRTSLAVKNDNTCEKKRLKDRIRTVSKPNNKRWLLEILRSSCREAHPRVMKCHSLSSAIPCAFMSNLSDIIILYILYYNLSDISPDLTAQI